MKRFLYCSFLCVFYIVIYSFFAVNIQQKVIMASASTVLPDSGSRAYEVLMEEAAQSKRVHLGGEPVGFLLNVQGVVIEDFHEVDTVAGMSILKSDLKTGDVILEVDGVAVETASEISKIINSSGGESNFLISRKGEKINVTVNPLVDRVSGEYRLGITVSKSIGGIGTLTFIKQDGRYGALGHCVGPNGYSVAINEGSVYECKILGIQKGVKGNAGSIKGTIERTERLGNVDKNTEYGIFGFMNEAGDLYDVASRTEVSCGKAKLFSSVSGEKLAYDVEIVKTMHQNEEEQKGIILKVTDKRLLALTGGIVQGMSGSPIVQNGKIIGAVTHVFINDPTRGYGVYVDWMLGQ